MAGGLYTGTIIDHAVASEFGTVSGFSASLGVTFQSIAQFIDDPAAVVEGIQALVALARDEGLGAVETIVDAMVQDVQQTQAQNNPYGSLDEKEHPTLYDTFRVNWYEGYAVGFLVKTALGGAAANSAKTAIKSTDTAQSIGSRLADTKALRALSRVSDAKEAAKARATARILLAVDGDASEALLSRADTAGGDYQLWCHQRAGCRGERMLGAAPSIEPTSSGWRRSSRRNRWTREFVAPSTPMRRSGPEKGRRH